LFRGKPIVDVVVDPLLTKHLRPHQVEYVALDYATFLGSFTGSLYLVRGVKFLYECTMGMRREGYGCILADEMYVPSTVSSVVTNVVGGKGTWKDHPGDNVDLDSAQ
jgi:DNA repair and recombination protein RAD54B